MPKPTMTQEEYRRGCNALCAKHGISPVEDSLLWTVAHYEGAESGSSIAEAAYALAEAAVPLPDYQAAVRGCLGRKWLRILTQADCDLDKRRWQHKPAHGVWDAEYVTETEYQPGSIDFTEQGARLYYGLAAAKARLGGHRPHEGTLCFTWHPLGMVRIWGAYPKDVAAQLHGMQTRQQGISDSMGWDCTDASQITHIKGPLQIPGWWMTRFLRISPGYYADVYYTPQTQEPAR